VAGAQPQAGGNVVRDNGRWRALPAERATEDAPGESHTLVAYECDEPMRVTFNVTGPLIWLDENGEPNGTFDVFDYIALVRSHYEKNGIGADYIDTLFR